MVRHRRVLLQQVYVIKSSGKCEHDRSHALRGNAAQDAPRPSAPTLHLDQARLTEIVPRTRISPLFSEVHIPPLHRVLM
jgi:hypothetical protein